MRYVVTGGCGFIGSHLCDRLVGEGHRVTVLDDLSTGRREYLPPRVTVNVASVADTGIFPPMLAEADGVFHLAAVASVERSRREWGYTHAVNQGGFVRLMEAVAALPKKIPIVYASSAAVYGDAVPPLAESMPAAPITAYGVDKLGCELHAYVGARVHGIPSLGLRFFNVYGHRQDPSSPYSGVVSLFMRQIPSGRSVTIFGDGEQTRDFIHVSDVVRTLLAAMRALEEGRVFHDVCNVCTGKEVSLLKLIAVIEEIGGKNAERLFAPVRAGDIRYSRGDAKKLAALLGTEAEMPLRDGLRMMLEAA